MEMEKEEIIGRKIGQIEITKLIGSGGMGSVYKGMHNFLGKEVAIKFLSKALVENKEFIDRFVREAQTLARVEHKNLVRVYDAGEWNDNYYIVMEFIRGQSLGDILKTKARLHYPEAAKIVKQCAQGLKAAALKSIIHRDIKPDNIMILEDGSVKLTDFGLAKSLESSMEITQTGQLMGTPHYMSPEQCDGANVDFRSDMYSLGATFYRIITGKFPYAGNTAFAVMRKHVEEPLTSPSAVINEVPGDVSLIIEKMMEKKPENRYLSYDEVIESLTAVEKGVPLDTAMEKTITPVPGTGTAEPESDVGTAQTIVDKTPVPGTPPSQYKGEGTSPTIVQGGKKNWMIVAVGALVVLLAVSGVIIAVLFMSKNGKNGSETETDNPGTEVTGQENTGTEGETGGEEELPSFDEAAQIFKKALAKYTSSRLDEADKFFEVIVNKHPMSEYADKATEYITKIEKIKTGISQVNSLISEFNIREAESIFSSLKLDVGKNEEWASIAAKITKLKGPVKEISSLYDIGSELYRNNELQEAIETLKKARKKAVSIGYGTAKIDSLINSAEKEKGRKDLSTFANRINFFLGDFKIAEAEQEMKRAKEKYGDEAKYRELITKLSNLKRKIKEISDLKIAALEYITKEKFDDALEKLEEAKTKAWAVGYSQKDIRILMSRAENGKKKAKEYSTAFSRAQQFFRNENLKEALNLAEKALSIRKTEEAEELAKRARREIADRNRDFKKDRSRLERLLKGKKTDKADSLLTEMARKALTDDHRSYLQKKRDQLQKLIAELEKEKEPREPDKVITDRTRGARMMLIPAGEVVMGSDAGPSICKPEHTVTISAFYMDVKEVTNREYEMYDPSHKAKRLDNADGDDIPVTNVSWKEAKAFCEWLSRKEGVIYRLPTEAEWERAAKGGRNYTYSSGSSFKGKINVSSSAPVAYKTYPPNAFGLYNMSGNVWEFCQDWVDVYSGSRQKDPVVTKKGKYPVRAIRGGSFRAKKPDATAAAFYRNGLPPDKPFRDTGFRCVRELK